MGTRTLRLQLHDADWDAYMLAAQARINEANASGWRRLTLHLPSIFLVALSIWTVATLMAGGQYRLPLYGLLAVMMFLGLLRLIGNVTARPSRNGVFLGPAEVELTATGMRLARVNYRSVVTWTQNCCVTSTPTHLFVWIDVFTAQVIPVRDLPEGLAPHELQTEINELIAARGSAPVNESGAVDSLPLSETPKAPDTVETAVKPASLPRVRDEVLQLLKLFHFGNADARLMYGRDATIVLLGSLATALLIGFERLALDKTAEFMWYTLPGTFWFVAIALAVAWVMSRTARPSLPFRQSLLLVSGYSVLAALLFGIGSLWGFQGEMIAFFILLVDAFLYFGRGLPLFSGRPQRRAFFSGLALLTSCVWLNSVFYWTPSFWYEPEPEFSGQQEETSRLDRDQLAFDQALKVQESLGTLDRGESPGSQFFFLGFAGFGEERVFAEEIDTAARSVDRQFDTRGRSLRLVNDRRDLEKYPWASTSAIKSTLRGMARVMDIEQDVLFLALSSHGSEEGYVSVNDGRPFSRDLYAVDLAEMLREAGIRWKVIVVSACHSGTFIEPLKDEYTIVITAAAAEKTSFGCSDDRDLTYFGEAFYRDALPGSANLRAAFDAARASIAKREAEEGIRASDPQAYFGSEIERKLENRIVSTRAEAIP